MADTPYPLPKSIRQTDWLIGTGATTYGPFGENWGIFDNDDVEVETRPAGGGEPVLSDAVAEKTSLAERYSPFTITFPVAITAATEYRVTGRRRHERALAVTRGGAVHGDDLELELSKQSILHQELRRDVAALPPPFPRASTFFGFDADGKPATFAQPPALTFIDGLRGKVRLRNGGTDWALDDGGYGGVEVSNNGRVIMANGGVWVLRDKAALQAATLDAVITQVFLTKSGTRWFRLATVPGTIKFNQVTSNGGMVAWEADIDVLDFAALGVKGDNTDESSIIADICNSIPTMQTAQRYRPTIFVLEAGKRYFAPNGAFHLFQNHCHVYGNWAVVRGGDAPAIRVTNNNSINNPGYCKIQNVWLCNDANGASLSPAVLLLSAPHTKIEGCKIAALDANHSGGGGTKACAGDGIELRASVGVSINGNTILRPGKKGVHAHGGVKTYGAGLQVHATSGASSIENNYIAWAQEAGIFCKDGTTTSIINNKIEVCQGGIVIDSMTDFVIEGGQGYFEVNNRDVEVRETANEFPTFAADRQVQSGLISGLYSTSTESIHIGTQGSPSKVIVRDNWLSGQPRIYVDAAFTDWRAQRNQLVALVDESATTVRSDHLVKFIDIDLLSIAASTSRLESNVSFSGAAIGDTVEVVARGDTQGLIFTADVPVANAVRMRTTNPTNAAVDLASINFQYIVKR
jgi:hypothetical protein